MGIQGNSFAICSGSSDISSKGLVPEVSIPPSISGVQPRELYSQGDDQLPKVRKPYTITKQREKWTEGEHKNFLEALKLYGRAWRKIEEHIGTKTAVQIRSHAQKFFTKVVRETASNGLGSSNTIEIPPPRPKRKPAHPYPRKLTNICKELSVALPESRYPSVPSAMGSSETISSVIQQENGSPLSASSATGFGPTEPNQVNCQSPVSSVEGSNPPSSVLSEQENGFPSSSSSSANFSPLGLYVPGEYNASSSPVLKSNESSWKYQPSTNVDSSSSNAAEVVPAKETDDGCASKSFLSETKTMSLKLFGQTVFVTDCQLSSATASTPSMTGDQQSSDSALGKEDSAENSAGDENDPIQTETHLTCQPQIPLEKSSPLQDPVEDYSCKSTWNSLHSGVPQMFYCLQYPQKDPNLEGVAIAPWCAVYGNFPFFVQSSASNDPSNSNDTGMPRGTGGVANLDLSGESRHLAMPEVDYNKERGSPTGSGTALASERGAMAGRFSFSNEGKLGCRNSGLFNRISSSGKGFVRYRRCIAETSTEEMPPLDGHKEEKRIRLCL